MKTCCEKCADIEDMSGDGIGGAREYCSNPVDCECHQVNYSHASHFHCWAQKQPSACGIPLEKHKQCCLCDLARPCCDNCRYEEHGYLGQKFYACADDNCACHAPHHTVSTLSPGGVTKTRPETVYGHQPSAGWEQRLLASGVKIPHKWHDYQDHCHNCGTEDAQKPCIPYALKSFISAELEKEYERGFEAGTISEIDAQE